RELLKKTQEHLQNLNDEESTAQELAEKHTTFDDLPGRIQKLEENVHYLEARIEVLQKILDLEVVMKDYETEKKWDQFINIRDQRKELGQTLRDLIEQNPSLQGEIEAQAYLEKPRLNAADI